MSTYTKSGKLTSKTFNRGSGGQNPRDVMDINEQRLTLDTEFLQMGKELEKMEKPTEEEDVKYNEDEEEDFVNEMKEFMLYLDDSNDSTEALNELKKNINFKLKCYVLKREDLQEVPEFIQAYPFLIDKVNKKAYAEKECIRYIKDKKICSMQWKGTKSNKLSKW